MNWYRKAIKEDPLNKILEDKFKRPVQKNEIRPMDTEKETFEQLSKRITSMIYSSMPSLVVKTVTVNTRVLPKGVVVEFTITPSSSTMPGAKERQKERLSKYLETSSWTTMVEAIRRLTGNEVKTVIKRD